MLVIEGSNLPVEAALIHLGNCIVLIGWGSPYVEKDMTGVQSELSSEHVPLVKEKRDNKLNNLSY